MTIRRRSKSECERKENLKRDGLEDWTKYVHEPESKVAIDYMESHSDEIKVFFTFNDLAFSC